MHTPWRDVELAADLVRDRKPAQRRPTDGAEEEELTSLWILQKLAKIVTADRNVTVWLVA